MKLKQKSVENYTFMLTFLCSIHKAQHCNTATAHNNLGKKWRNWGQSPYKSESAYPSPMITLKYCREIKTVVKNTAEQLRKFCVPNTYRIISNRRWLFWFDSQRDYLLNVRDKNSQNLLLMISQTLLWFRFNATIFSLKAFHYCKDVQTDHIAC